MELRNKGFCDTRTVLMNGCCNSNRPKIANLVPLTFLKNKTYPRKLPDDSIEKVYTKFKNGT